MLRSVPFSVFPNAAAVTGCPADAGCLWGEAAMLWDTIKGTQFPYYYDFSSYTIENTLSLHYKDV
jgi:hypothetical protein